jgi:hypothetical protein
MDVHFLVLKIRFGSRMCFHSQVKVTRHISVGPIRDVLYSEIDVSPSFHTRKGTHPAMRNSVSPLYKITAAVEQMQPNVLQVFTCAPVSLP